MEIKLYNTLTRKKEKFTPIIKNNVGMYSCGPTVHNEAHIGNLRAFITSDLLRRMFEYNNYTVKHIVNITDVGHLVSDGDTGEDKMTKALKRLDKELTLENMISVGDFYTKRFKTDLSLLNIKQPHKTPKASDHIQEQINIIDILIKKKYAYIAENGVYFDISKFSKYADFALLNLKEMRKRLPIDTLVKKRNPQDFALWKFDDNLGWDSVWGKGFPGWHIECSAMSMKYLGEHFDIHTGGIDLIPVHHTNEIAQSECATGNPLANYWIHTEFMNLGNEKMSKSKGNIVTLKTLIKEGISPISYRYWIMTTHYRTQTSFSWEALLGAQNAVVRIYKQFIDLGSQNGKIDKTYQKKFLNAMNNDLNTPEVIVVMWKLLKDISVSNADKRATLLDIDGFLKLSIEKPDDIIQKLIHKEIPYERLPLEVQRKVKERNEARENKDWDRADMLRSEIKSAGFSLLDKDKKTIISEN